tara:strand:+ start:395 stop:1117 length:723 start_codon:yes stop_codon:yes gene_type:complete
MKTTNYKEIEKFSNLAEEWWNPNGKFKPLHKFNPSRIKYIKSEVAKHYKLNSSKKIFEKLTVLDIGCGGGLLSEPMSRMGATVTGIDASIKNIKTAMFHANKNNLKIKYLVSSPEKLNTKTKYDIILNMEIVEHVSNLNFFIESCSKLLKKNGIMFVATLNKTLKSYLFAIIGAEYVLRWLPIGTHDWNAFVKPESLINICSNSNLKLNSIDGFNYSPIFDQWNVSKDKSVNYITSFIKT